MLRRSCLAMLGGLGAMLAAAPLLAQEVSAVASFSILGDLVRNVGGERVGVATIVGPDKDMHSFSPSPADARRLGGAKVVFVNGLGFEGWMTRLIAASGSKAPIVTVSQGVRPRRMQSDGHSHSHGADPHAWQSVANVKTYVANIRDGLKRVDLAGAAAYDANAKAYLERLDGLERDIKAAIEKIPADRRKVITTHDAFGYFAADYGVAFIAPEGVSADAASSAKDVARIITQVRRQSIPAVFLENVSDPRLMQQIARETGAKVGGTLYSDALSAAGGPAASYIALMRSNVGELTKALAP